MKKEYLEAVNAEAGNLLVDQAITPEEYATWQKMLGIMANRLYFNGEEPDTFGKVEWCDDDIINALDDEGINPTPEMISEVHDRLQHHSFCDHQIEAGWEFIGLTIMDILEDQKRNA